MNDRSLITPSEPGGNGGWLDAYLPETGVAPTQSQAQFVSLANIRGVMFRQRWLVAGVVLAALIAGLVFTLLSTPMYEARAKVSVEPYGTYILEGQDVEQGIASNQVGDYLATQVELIKSRSIAEIVAADRQLGERNDLLGPNIDEQRPPNQTDEQWLKTKEGYAASRLTQNVVATLPLRSWVIEVGYRSEDPVLAAEMANAFADAFVASETRETLDNNEYAIEYLRGQIDTVRGRLEEAERVANSYARNQGIIVQGSAPDGISGGNGPTLTTSNLTDINTRFVEARAARIQAEQKWRAIQDIPANQLPEFQTNSFLQQLTSERTQKLTEIAELRQRYNDDFPQIRDLLARVAVIDEQIEGTSADLKATIRNEFIVARNQEQALEAEVNSLSSESLSEQDDLVQFTVLEREAEALRLQLRILLDRFNQINSAATVNKGRMTIIENALVPGAPYAPSIMQNIGLSLVVGIGLAAGLALLRETFDDRIRSLDEVEQKIGLPLIGHTPYVSEDDIDAESSNNFTTLMEAYASIKAAIDFSLPRTQNVIQLTSTNESEGKSTTAVVLAELFARSGRKTLLIDADLRRPSVARLLDFERPKEGFIEVLLGHSKLEDVIIKGVDENLDVLPIGAIPPNPTEILSSNELKDFIAKYREEYSLILFDSCPVLGLADAPLLGRAVDNTVFVLEANRVPFSQARQAIKRLSVAGGNVIGLILTKYRALEAGQSYGYGYSYYTYGDKA